MDFQADTDWSTVNTGRSINPQVRPRSGQPLRAQFSRFVDICIRCWAKAKAFIRKPENGKSGVEPVSGIEPLTCRLQEARFVTICTLTALMAQVIALMALVELEFPGSSSHDSSHAAEQQLTRTCDAA